MRGTHVNSLCGLGALLLSACVTTRLEPAIIVDGTPETHAELIRAVSGLLGVETVTIADDALTKESTLLIDRAPARDASGRRLSGRDLGKPEQFDLVKRGRECVLVHASTGTRRVLAGTSCAVSR